MVGDPQELVVRLSEVNFGAWDQLAETPGVQRGTIYTVGVLHSNRMPNPSVGDFLSEMRFNDEKTWYIDGAIQVIYTHCMGISTPLGGENLRIQFSPWIWIWISIIVHLTALIHFMSFQKLLLVSFQLSYWVVVFFFKGVWAIFPRFSLDFCSFKIFFSLTFTFFFRLLFLTLPSLHCNTKFVTSRGLVTIWD